MAATTQLAKIADLTERLAPLAGKQRGMPIEHDDWNALVDVLRGLLEIDHAQEDSAQSDLEQRFALKSHDHLGEVTLAWLDPSLQSTVGDGGGGGVATRTAIASIQQKVDALNAQLAQLTQRLDQHQQTLDRYAVNDVDRARALGAFDARFAGVENLRTAVTGLGSQIDGLTANVKTVLDLRASLSDANGTPIDVGQIRQDVSSLKELTANFNGVDGSPVRMRDLQLQLKEVSDAVGVGGPGGLEGRLGDLSTDLENRLDQKADLRSAALHDQLLTEQNARSAQLQADVQSSVKVALDAQSASVATSLRDSETRLTQSFNSSLSTAVAGVRTDLTAATTAALDQRLAPVTAQIATLTQTSADLQSALPGQISTRVTAEVQLQVSAAEGRLNTRIATVEAGQQSFQDRLTAQLQTSVTSAVSALGADLGTRLTAQVTQAQTTLQGRLDTNLASATSALTAALPTQVGTTVDQRLSDLGRRISDGVASALTNLPTQIAATVDQRLTQADVAGQIQRSAASVTQQLRTEFTQAVNDQQTRTTTAINGVLTQLRGEISVAQKAASDDAVTRASTLIASAQDTLSRSFTSQVDSLRTETNTRLGTLSSGTGIRLTPISPIVLSPLSPILVTRLGATNPGARSSGPG